MEKNNCYVFWDGDNIKDYERKVYIQCEECHKKNKKGFKWAKEFLHGILEIKCSLCDTIIYKKEKKKKGADEAQN